jgi:SAM-dependent methyltransferase
MPAPRKSPKKKRTSATKSTRARVSADAMLAGMSRHDLYEACVQSPEDAVPLLRAIHGGDAAVLGEDFAGTAALSRAWVRDEPSARAIAVELDAATLAEARRRADAAGADAARLELVHGDVRTATDPRRHAADVVYVGNFSIGELTTRADLVAYLRHVRSRLRPGGVFACDVYGGQSAYMLGTAERPEPGPDGRTILYTWEQREADPLTGRVVNALHFEVLEADGSSAGRMPDAFTYHWRLWSVPELRDVMAEAGFASSEAHGRQPDAIDGDGEVYVRPITDPGELEESFDVLVVGRR